MKLTPWYFVALAPIAVAGCSGAFLGQLAVLAAVMCIFIGTLSLGRDLRSRTGTRMTAQVKLSSPDPLPTPCSESPYTFVSRVQHGPSFSMAATAVRL